MSKPSRARWILRRLAAMSPSEIIGRLGAKLQEELEPPAQRRLERSVPANLRRREITLPPNSEAPADLGKQLAEEAPLIKAGRRTIFNHLTVEIGAPPRWQYDPLVDLDLSTTARAHEINHRNLPQGADVRVVWELNRWSPLVRLAQAQYLGIISDGAVFCQSQLTDWRAANPLGCGWNWTSPMEPAIRLIQLAWMDVLLEGQSSWGSEVAPLAFEHAFWVWRYRSFGSSANNHLIGELAGLICATARWPDLEKIVPLETVTAALEKEILRQFAPDGGNREQALHYHLFALEYGLQAAFFLRALDRPFRPDVLARLAAAADFFAAMAPPQEGWDYGDSDDAHVVPLFAKMSSHLAEWQRWCAGEKAGSGLAYWFPSRETLIGPPMRARERWIVFPDSGLAVTQRDAWFLRFDASPLGYLSTRAHGHLDALHLSAWLEGAAFLIDPGTGSYFVDGELRALLASAERHNGPFLPSGHYPERHGTFLWAKSHPTPLLKNDRDGLEGELHLGPESARRVIREIPGGFAVEDLASSKGQVRWTLAPGWKITGGGDQMVASMGSHQIGLKFRGSPGPPIVEEVVCSPSFRRTERTLSIVLPMDGKVVLQSAFTVLSRP